MSMQFFLMILAATIPAYVLGSVNGALVTSKMLYRKDIRDYGSGNAGLTNFYRVFGKAGALLVVLIDVLKTVIPVVFGGWLFAHFYEESFFGQALASFAVVFGHCFPVFYKFRGGKGVMALGAIVIVIDWRVALIAWGVFIVVTAISRYVSLGAILGSSCVPVALGLLNIGGLWGLVLFVLSVMLIVIRHAENIKRLFKGDESKFSFKRKSGVER